MGRIKLSLDRFEQSSFPVGVVALLWMGCFSISALCQQPGQKTFSSAEDASSALISAAQNNDEKAMLEILGPDATRIVSSGDAAEDAESRMIFVKKYQQMHRLAIEPDGTTTLYVGAENWPTPIPLLRKGDSWYFDTEAGEREIVYRRVGRNELSAIRICQELVAAQKEYYAAQHKEYCPKIISDEGQHNGLYWKAAGSEPESPVGPLVAMAVAKNGDSKGSEGGPTPFRGYYFRVLTHQGKNGPGGAKSYIVNGKMTGGVAFVAYPADYRSSGVMTFIVGEDGVVYQKDLGKKTEALGQTMKEYSPNSSWRKAEEEEASVDQGTR